MDDDQDLIDLLLSQTSPPTLPFTVDASISIPSTMENPMPIVSNLPEITSQHLVSPTPFNKLQLATNHPISTSATSFTYLDHLDVPIAQGGQFGVGRKEHNLFLTNNITTSHSSFSRGNFHMNTMQQSCHSQNQSPPYQIGIQSSLHSNESQSIKNMQHAYHTMGEKPSLENFPLAGYSMLENHALSKNYQAFDSYLDQNQISKGKHMDLNVQGIDSFLAGQVRPGPDTPYIYKCGQCSIEFPNAQAYGGHMSSHSKARKMNNSDTKIIAQSVKAKHKVDVSIPSKKEKISMLPLFKKPNSFKGIKNNKGMMKAFSQNKASEKEKIKGDGEHQEELMEEGLQTKTLVHSPTQLVKFLGDGAQMDIVEKRSDEIRKSELSEE